MEIRLGIYEIVTRQTFRNRAQSHPPLFCVFSLSLGSSSLISFGPNL